LIVIFLVTTALFCSALFTVDEILPMWRSVDQIGRPHRENAKVPPHREVHIGRPPMRTTTGAPDVE
jgi:hypothetical protein